MRIDFRWAPLLLLTAACATTRTPTTAASSAAAPSQPEPPVAAGESRQPARFVPATVYSGGDGSSVEQAVVVMADNEDQGVDREYRWIFDHYGKFRKTGVGLATVGQHKYDVIKIELADHSEKEIYFDITSFFGKAAPK